MRKMRDIMSPRCTAPTGSVFIGDLALENDERSALSGVPVAPANT
jgi:hypothetical protein